jgi:hypothetical protein
MEWITESNPMITSKLSTVVSWCPGDNCDPCLFRPAFPYTVFIETLTTGGYISGGHVQYNFGRTFYPVALAVFETVSKYIGFKGGTEIDGTIPVRYIVGDVDIGEGPSDFQPKSFWEDTCTLTVEFMGEIIYQTNLARIRNFFGYGGPGPTDNPIFSDGQQVNYDPHDVFRLPPNQLTPYFNGGIAIAADDVTNTPLQLADLQPGILYNGAMSSYKVSFVIGTNPDGTPDRSAVLMEGFIYDGPYDPSQDIIFDVWIQNLSPIGPANVGYRGAHFGPSDWVLWYRGPNPSA